MNGFSIFAADMDMVWTRIALSLAHSLWVGAAIGVVTLMLFFLLRRNRFHAARYDMLVLALFSIAVSPALIFMTLAPNTISPQVMANQPIEVAVNDSAIDSAADTIAETTQGIAQMEPSDSVATDKPVANVGVSIAASPEADTVTVIEQHDVAKIAVALYGAISIALLTRLFLGITGGTWLRRRSELVTDGAMLGAAAKNAAALGLRFSPAIAYCSKVAVPTVVGVVRPMILLPLSCAMGITPEQVEYLVLHELAHIRRYDHIVNLVQRVIEALMFYHPVVWLISRQIRIEREQCCDDLVVGLRGNAQQYAESLLAAATFASSARKALLVSPATLSATGKVSHLRARIARILGEPAPAVRIRHGGWIAAVAVVLCVLGGTQLFASNQETDLPSIDQETGEDTNTEPRSEDSSEETANDEPGANIDTNLLLHEIVNSVSDLKGIQISGMSIADGEGDERRVLIEISVASDTPINNFVEESERIKVRATELVHERYGKNATLGDGKHLADDPISISITSMPAPADRTESGEAMDSDTDTLYRQLRDKDWWLRKVAIQQLADSGPKDVYLSLIRLLKDEDERVQVAAANALGKLKAPESIPHLVAALKESRETSDAAAEALAQFAPEQVMPLVRMAAEDEDLSVQRGAIKALRELKSPETIGLLINLLGEIPKQSEIRSGQVRATTARRPGNAVSHMNTDALSMDLAAAMSELEPATGTELIDLAKAHTDWRVRAGLMKVLAAQLIDRNNQSVSPELKTFLSREEVVRAQVDAMKDEQKEVRAWAAYGLGKAFQVLADDAALTELRRNALIAGLHDANLQIAGICGEFLVSENSVQLTNEADAIALMIAREDIDGLVTRGDKAIPAILTAINRDFSAPLSDEQRQGSIQSLFLAETLMRIGGPDTIQPLIELLKIANDDAKATIANALGNTGDPRAVDALLQLVNNSNSNVQYAALESLGKLQDPRVFEPLSAVLSSPNDDLRTIAVRGLGNLGDPRSVNVLIERIAEEETTKVLTAAIESLGKLGDKAAVPPLLTILAEKDVENERGRDNSSARAAAAQALGELGAMDAVPALVTTLRTDRNGDVRQASAAALGRIKDPTAIEVLIDTVKFDENARRAAANALAAISSPESIHALYALYPTNTSGMAEEIMIAIVYALIYSEHPAAHDALFELLRDNRIPEEKHQLRAALALAKREDPRATGFLNKLRGNPGTRIESERALSELGSKGDAGERDAADAMDEAVLTPTASLETHAPLLQFRLVVKGETAEGKLRLPAPTEEEPDRTLAVENEIWITEADIETAVARPDSQTGNLSVVFKLKSESGKKMKELSEANQGRGIAIIYKGRVLSAPIISSSISSMGSITGKLTMEEAEEIVQIVKEGDGESLH